jgi:hypothetical protein
MLLPKIIGKFKMQSAKQINKIRNTLGIAVWQRNYYKHIIRHENELNRIREYIVNNPFKWCYVNIIYVLFVKIEFKCFQYNADIAQKFI